MTAAVMNTWDVYWGLRVSECPCDVHFVEWLEENGVSGKTIYHMGSGGHHYVGVRCAEPELDNRVLSITASTPEYEAFIKLAKEQPALLHHYTCYFGDIYTSHADLLPTFDVVTLFHACEFRNEKNDAYGALTDLQVMELFRRQAEARRAHPVLHRLLRLRADEAASGEARGKPAGGESRPLQDAAGLS